MNWENDQLNDLAARAQRGEPGAMTAWCDAREMELAPIVRRALRHGVRPDHPDHTGLTERILATAQRLKESDPTLAVAGREGLVRPIARELARDLAQAAADKAARRPGDRVNNRTLSPAHPLTRSAGQLGGGDTLARLGAMDTVCV